MESTKSDWVGLLILLLIIITFLLTFIFTKNWAYKEGQLDALRGVYKYEIRKDDKNNEIIWNKDE